MNNIDPNNVDPIEFASLIDELGDITDQQRSKWDKKYFHYSFQIYSGLNEHRTKMKEMNKIERSSLKPSTIVHTCENSEQFMQHFKEFQTRA